MKLNQVLLRSLSIARHLPPALGLVALAGLFAGPSAADPGPVRLVADSQSEAKNFGSNPESTITADNQVFFIATDPTRGEELWRSDGTTEGTRLVADLTPGRQGSYMTLLGTVGNQVIFRQALGIWVSDGTDPGTRQLADLCSECSSRIVGSISLSDGKRGDKVLFRVDHRTLGGALWVSDGTPEGTGPMPGVSFPRFMPNLFGLLDAGTAVFPVRDTDHNYTLWRSDGTPEGTLPYQPLCEGCHVEFTFMTPAGGKVYFTTGSSATGPEPWVTDGTPEGTQMLIDTIPGPIGNYDYGWLEYEGTIYGLLYECPDLCIVATDGTPEGTRFAPELYPDVEGLKPSQMQTAGSDLVMSFYNETEERYELWNVGGAEMSRLQTSPWLRLFNIEVDLELDGRVIYATRSEIGSAAALWATDGSSIQKLADVEPDELAILGDSVIFQGTVASADGTHDSEPWISDGTPSGTRQLLEIYPPTTDSNPTEFLAWGSDLVFWTEEERLPNPWPRQLRRTDGVTSTLLRTDTSRWTTTVAGGRLYAADFDAEWVDVFEPDGDVSTVDIGQLPWDMVAIGRRVLISGARSGQPLWISRGTQLQTQQIADINPDWFPPCPPLLCYPTPLEGYPDQLTPLGRQVLFVAFEDDDRSQLWSTSGEVGDAQLLAEFELDPDTPTFVESPHPEQITTAGNVAFFTAFDLPTGRELWATDGTPEGSHLLADLSPGAESSDIRHLTAWGSRVVFALGTETGDQLWLAKHQAQRLVDLGPKAQIHQIVATARGLFIAASTPEHGRELHVFNRQSAQGHRIFDLRPGPRGSGVADITLISGGILFAADHGQGSGHEPWVSDGTLAGTHLLIDLYPGPEASSPGQGLQIGNTVYFAATSPTVGRELFALDLGPED